MTDDEARRAIQVGRLGCALSGFYTPDDVVIWLDKPHPQLDGKRAIDEMLFGDPRRVWGILARMEGDDYV